MKAQKKEKQTQKKDIDIKKQCTRKKEKRTEEQQAQGRKDNYRKQKEYVKE